MMTQVPLYVIGGRQRQDRGLSDLKEGWYGYGLGVILRVDPDGRITTVMEFTSRPGACGPDDPILFKCASRRDDRLYCCTQTEVIVFSLPTFEQLVYVSLPGFNDVHHVLPTAQGTMLIAVSGLEMVVEIDEKGDVLGEWNVLGGDPWNGFDPRLDYRQGVNTKPHRAHPNHLFQLDGRPWVTRFELRDAVPVSGAPDRIEVGHERVHDGVVRDDGVYFTTVDGSVVRCDTTGPVLRGRRPLLGGFFARPPDAPSRDRCVDSQSRYLASSDSNLPIRHGPVDVARRDRLGAARIARRLLNRARGLTT
jgi:hypothetical protein